MMKRVIVIRDFISEELSLGICVVRDENNEVLFTSQSLERGWLNNAKMISCIPEGVYPLRLERSDRFNMDLWEVYDVPNRSECKYHAANFSRQLNGCIALGEKRIDIDNDGLTDVTNSRKTMARFHEAMAGGTEATLHVINSQTS
jgi:hypothetical protein